MPYTNEYTTPTNWSAALDGFIQLVQLATAAASAKILQDPEAKSVLQRGYVVPYCVDAALRDSSFLRFNERISLITTEYCELQSCFKKLHDQLYEFSQDTVFSLRWEGGQGRNLAHDCVEINCIRQRIAQHLSQCAILHAQALCAVTTYLENIKTAYVCPPQNTGPVITSVGSMPDRARSDEAEHDHSQGDEPTGRSGRGSRTTAT